MLYLFDKRYFALLSFPLLSFALQKYIFASNTFLHQIHFCTAFVFCCAKNTAASNTFLHQMHFYTITMRSLAFSGQLCSMCGGMCVALLNIFLWKMWCWTFYKGKCDAEHFTKENVMLNILQRKMWCWTFSFGKCTRCKNAFWHQMHLMPKCIWCQNAFDAKLHLMPKCILAYIFQRKMFSKASNAFLHRHHAYHHVYHHDSVFCFAKNKFTFSVKHNVYTTFLKWTNLQITAYFIFIFWK